MINRFGPMAVALVGAALTAVSMPTSAVTLQVSGGELVGALNVNVDGTLYDVEFVDGTCVALFSGCDETSDFAFNTQIQADAASQALLDQVLVDGPQGNFDSQPTLTSGCEPNTAASYCAPLTPFILASSGVGSSEIFNQPGASPDTITFGFLPIDFDTTSSAFLVYARWTLSAQIPEPSTVALLAIAFAGLGFGRRKFSS